MNVRNLPVWFPFVALALVLLLGYAVVRSLSGTSGLSGTLEETDEYYEIAAHYATSTPLLSSAGKRKDQEAVALMKGFIDEEVRQFKANGNFENLSPEDLEMLGFAEGRRYSLRILYLIAEAPRTVSYIYTIYEDTGGAHGNMRFRTFVFDRTDGAHLELEDLFAPDAPYLERLSSISRERLPEIIGAYADQEFIGRGTGPQEENFAQFFIGGTTLGILFPPYQVAAYAAGPQTLPIPLAELSALLKPAFR